MLRSRFGAYSRTGRGRFEFVSVLGGPAYEAFHSSGPIGCFISLDPLADIFWAVLQQSIDPFCQFAGSGHERFGCSSSGFDSTVECSQSVTGVIASLHSQT